MRVGLAQINSTLGNFKENAEKINSFIQEAKEKKCELVVFPECALFGYHPFDMLERATAAKNQIKQINLIAKKIPKGISVLVGVILPRNSSTGRPYYNSAVLLTPGKKPRFFHKTLLPTGDVFDEARFIEPGDVTKNLFKIGHTKILLTICEDIWAWPNEKKQSIYTHNPLLFVDKKDIDLVINMSASPWHVGKMKLRQQVISKTAKHFKAPMIYMNMVGGQDEIVFDGQSLVFDSKGKIRGKSLAFEECLNVVELKDLKTWTPTLKISPVEELRQALVLGLRDFIRKTGLSRVHLGLSGGVDSALVACLAVDALGPNQVSAVALPGPFSAIESLELAKQLAKNLNIDLITIPIQKIYETYDQDMMSLIGVTKFGLVHENLQARIRGSILMAVSNAKNSMLLATSNKSELATGYSTLYGDLCGGLAPIGDLTKKQVYDLCELYNREQKLIPPRIISRAPTAELRAGQKDQDTLPEYDLLDAAVVSVVENCKSANSQVEKWLLQQIFKSEFKRWQAPPIIKISGHAFGRGRRYPIAHRYSEFEKN
jgi:NAD+ synthase (glutamine-hydrolysing)